MSGTRTRQARALAQLPLLLILLFAGAARAEPNDTDEEGRDDRQATLEEYVRVDVSAIPQSNTIGTKLPTDLQITPAIVGTVSSELFREQQAVTLSDVLENVAGLNIQSQNGVQDFFVLRGYDSLSGSLVMVDGAAVPEATIYSTYNIEGVEVLKGPGGFLYGGDPLAGAVNMVRKQPVANDFFNAEISGGSFGTYQGAVDWNTTTEDHRFSFRLNGFYRESDGYRDDKSNDHWALNPGFAVQIGERSSIHVNLESIEASYSPDAGLPLIGGALPDVDRETSYQSIFDFSDQSIGRAQVDYQTRLTGNVTLRNKTYFRDLDWQSAGTLVFHSPFAPAPPVSRALTTLDNQQRFIGNQFEAVFRLGAGRVKHSLLAGVEVAQRDNDFIIEAGQLSPVDLVGPVDPDTMLPFLAPVEAGTAESTILASYVVDQIEFSPRCHVMLGVRYDDIDFDSSTSRFGAPATPTNLSDGHVSPRAGFLWAPDETLSLYANAAGSFAPPEPRVVGPQEPQESDQLEVGVKKTFMGGKVRTVFALFELNRENLAIPDDNQFTQQLGDQESRGVEIELAAEPAPGLRAFFSYAYTDAELTHFMEEVNVSPDPLNPSYVTFDRTGNVPAFVPEHLANLWVSKRIGERWTVGGGLRFIGDQFIDEDNAYEIEAATVLDAMLSYRRDGWRINLNLKNLTDEEYELRGFGSQSVIPADPFAVYATIGFDL